VKSWTEADFETLCFHDVHVHGIAIVESEQGTGQLTLDIDYILEWLCDSKKSNCKFRIAPAVLVFREISGLRFSIDYATPKRVSVRSRWVEFIEQYVRKTDTRHTNGRFRSIGPAARSHSRRLDSTFGFEDEN
jgi:hypothetical protein